MDVIVVPNSKGALFKNVYLRNKQLNLGLALNKYSIQLVPVVERCLADILGIEEHQLNSAAKRYVTTFCANAPYQYREAGSNLSFAITSKKKTRKYFETLIPIEDFNVVEIEPTAEIGSSDDVVLPMDTAAPSSDDSDTGDVPDVMEPVAGPSKKRPVSYADAHRTTKSKRVATLVGDINHPPDEIIRAAIKIFKDRGHKSAARILEILNDDPEDLEPVREFICEMEAKPKSKSYELLPFEGLGHLLECGMTETAYKKTAKRGNVNDHKIWPPIYKLREEKKKIRPEIIATEFDAICPLEGLLHKTIDRLMEDQDIKKKVQELVQLNNGHLTIEFISKIGMDGFKNNPFINQRLQDPSSRDQGSCFASCMVPLQLVCEVAKKIQLLWHNTKCNSPYSVRPLRLWFRSENERITLEEFGRIKAEYDALSTYQYSNEVKFDFNVMITMVDNLVKNRILGNRNQSRCPFCGGTMGQCMDVDLDLQPTPESLGLMCLSILHFLLHIFDHVFKVGFRMHLEKWNAAMDDDERRDIQERKDLIKAAYEARGLYIFTMTTRGLTNGMMLF